MKKVILPGVIISLLFTGCAKNVNKSLQGGWQLVQMQRINNGKVTNYFSDRYEINQIKMWSGAHFIFVGRYKVDTVTTYRFGSGTYTLDGTKYVEDILYHFSESYEGQKNTMMLEIKDDTLLHVFPVDSKGQPDENQYYIEKYIRVE